VGKHGLQIWYTGQNIKGQGHQSHVLYPKPTNGKHLDCKWHWSSP